MLIKSLCGQQLHITQDTTFEFISMTNHYPSIWWFVGWLIIFYPVLILLIIMGLTRKAYVCKVDGVVVTLNQQQYNSIMMLNNKKESSNG
jgi:hypothetical protein